MDSRRLSFVIGLDKKHIKNYLSVQGSNYWIRLGPLVSEDVCHIVQKVGFTGQVLPVKPFNLINKKNTSKQEGYKRTYLVA